MATLLSIQGLSQLAATHPCGLVSPEHELPILASMALILFLPAQNSELPPVL